MQITKITRNEEDGSISASFHLSQDQVMFLINFAVGILVKTGLAELVETPVEGEEVSIPEINLPEIPAPEAPTSQE